MCDRGCSARSELSVHRCALAKPGRGCSATGFGRFLTVSAYEPAKSGDEKRASRQRMGRGREWVVAVNGWLQ
jgi:hypothetical protein